MEVEGGVPLDDKAKRMRDLLSSFYSPDPSSASLPPNTSSRFATLDTINTTSFDADLYMNLLVQKSNLEGLLQKHVEMAAEIKNLDTDLQMLVYENYNKFICATDTIKRMKNNIVGMETNMEELLEKIMSVQSRSDRVNTSLFEKREHIEKLHRTRNLLRKVQFIYDLPTRLEKCIRSEAYADAVKFYTGAMPIFKAYGDSSFQDCKRASEEAMTKIIKNLQDFRQLLDENPELLLKLRGLTIDWVGEGFQDFFRGLDDHFLLLPGRRIEASQDVNVIEGMQGEKIAAGLVLVLAQLSLFIEQNAIPIITEEIATSFSGGGVQGFDSGPAFVPAEICRIFRSSVHKHENSENFSSLEEEVHSPELGQAQRTQRSAYVCGSTSSGA